MLEIVSSPFFHIYYVTNIIKMFLRGLYFKCIVISCLVYLIILVHNPTMCPLMSLLPTPQLGCGHGNDYGCKFMSNNG